MLFRSIDEQTPSPQQPQTTQQPTFQTSTTSNPQQQKQSPEVKKLIDYLNNAGKTALGNINTRKELNDVLTAIWNGMNTTMKKDANAKSVYTIISQKIK